MSFNALRSSAASLRGPLDVEGSLFLPPRSPFFFNNKIGLIFQKQKRSIFPDISHFGAFGTKIFFKNAGIPCTDAKVLEAKYWRRQWVGFLEDVSFWHI